MKAMDEDKDEDDSLFLPCESLEKSNFVVLYRPNQNWMELFKSTEFAARHNSVQHEHEHEHELVIDESVVVPAALDFFGEELVRYKKSGKYSYIFTQALCKLCWHLAHT